MPRRTIGIVDYGVGNQASVWRALHQLGYRCRVSSDPAKLDETDILFLPGVGSFPAAMEQLHAHDLVGYLKQAAHGGKPFVGLCLGMQLLAERSHEHGLTAGLGLIPGEVVPFDGGGWHIGWNAIERIGDDPLFAACDGMAMYFNHSFIFRAPREYQVYAARTDAVFPVGVRRGNLVGMQFHPEKSQEAGRALLRSLVEGLCR
ncbi:imidazole glycerol phosphate synthase subunit HisH [Erythrobacter sp. JK5]|uniref:imidazole glycerol phosphate synthase subunit HisH n=1 Tax=Erythrobacter sp. JK5 TaxID=2829500 RepID=UPI001BA88A12|nr:imidazole glycerol phosphate synthase subunit HisH [Erythrobacter sp. JK5]QUL37338.1 imidazole glycerol phosphate synthase subunit HisH [Erythrobacter sp. JK5]